VLAPYKLKHSRNTEKPIPVPDNKQEMQNWWARERYTEDSAKDTENKEAAWLDERKQVGNEQQRITKDV